MVLLTSCTVVKDTPKQQISPEKRVRKLPNDDSYLKFLANRSVMNSIVLLVPLSGSNANLGRNILNAALQSNINEQLDIYAVDTNNLPDDLNISQFPNVKAVIGPVFSHEVNKIAPIFSSVPVLTLSNNIKLNNGHIFACGLSPQDEFHSIFSYLQKNGISSIAFILPGGKFSDELVASAQKIASEYRIHEDEIDVLFYEKSAKNDIHSFIAECDKKALFICEPLINIKNLSIPVFTMSSIALSDPQRWNGIKIASDENENQKKFISEYSKFFHFKPTTISLVAADLINVIDYAISNNAEIFDIDFRGICGNFSLKKGQGIKRNLRILTLLDGGKIDRELVKN